MVIKVLECSGSGVEKSKCKGVQGLKGLRSGVEE
jgi:hypothetical protein